MRGLCVYLSDMFFGVMHIPVSGRLLEAFVAQSPSPVLPVVGGPSRSLVRVDHVWDVPVQRGRQSITPGGLSTKSEMRQLSVIK